MSFTFRLPGIAFTDHRNTHTFVLPLESCDDERAAPDVWYALRAAGIVLHGREGKMNVLLFRVLGDLRYRRRRHARPVLAQDRC
jgi:hypothetical protein